MLDPRLCGLSSSVPRFANSFQQTLTNSSLGYSTGLFRLSLWSDDASPASVLTFQFSFHPFGVPKGEVGDVRFEVGTEAALLSEG